MPEMTRRTILAGGAAAVLHSATSAAAVPPVDEVLRSGIAQRRIPAVVAAAANAHDTLYTAAFGTRDSSGVLVRADSLFGIASMTKAITTAAALQLVEQGKVDLSEPVARH